MSVIGNNIKALRKSRNLTQQELAYICGVTRETVNKWETGLIAEVRASNVQRLLDYFDLTIDDLRSESLGLGSWQRSAPPPRTRNAAPTIPVQQGNLDLPDRIEILASLAAKHPGAYAMPVPDDSMSRVVPKGALVVIDPNMNDAGMLDGAVVLVDGAVAGKGHLLRRLRCGTSKAILSPESYLESEGDLVVDLSELALLGKAVWFAPSCEL